MGEIFIGYLAGISRNIERLAGVSGFPDLCNYSTFVDKIIIFTIFTLLLAV